MVFQDFSRILSPEKVMDRVVFDLDELVSGVSKGPDLKERNSSNSTISPKRSTTLYRSSTGRWVVSGYR